jgi:hypothetical protein
LQKSSTSQKTSTIRSNIIASVTQRCRLPQKAFQVQSLNRAKTPYPGSNNIQEVTVPDELDDRTAREIVAGIFGPSSTKREPAERVACLENRLLDAEEANEQEEPLTAEPRAKTIKL